MRRLFAAAGAERSRALDRVRPQITRWVRAKAM
jgi:hypothetical protein